MSARLSFCRRICWVFTGLFATALPFLSLAQAGGTGGITAQAPTAAGGVATPFDFPITPTSAPADIPRFKLVPLPVWHEPRGLGHNGTVVLYDWNTGAWVAWRNGQMTPIDDWTLKSPNKNGDLLRIHPVEGASLLHGNGAATAIVLTGLDPVISSVFGFSRNYAVGRLVTALDANGQPVSSLPVRWDFSGGYQPLGEEAGFPEPLLVGGVNDRGDYLAAKFCYNEIFGFNAFEGTFINTQFVSGWQGLDLNDNGVGLLVDENPIFGAVGPLAIWDGALRLVSPGITFGGLHQ